MTRNTQNTISTIWIFLASFVFTFMVGWIVYEMIEKSPDIDYTKSYSVEEVQKLVDDYHDFRDKVIMVLNQFESIEAVDRL